MNIQEVATKLVELCRNGKNKEAYETLYSAQAVCTEGDGSVTRSLEAIIKKSALFQAGIEIFHGITVSEPIVSEDHFAVTMTVDATYTGGYRNVLNEVCVYEVINGKIVSEQYFFPKN